MPTASSQNAISLGVGWEVFRLGHVRRVAALVQHTMVSGTAAAARDDLRCMAVCDGDSGRSRRAAPGGGGFVGGRARENSAWAAKRNGSGH